MIPDEFQMSQISFRFPPGLPYGNNMLTVFDEELPFSQMNNQTFPSLAISPQLPFSKANSSQLCYQDENSDKNNSSSKRKFFTKEEDRLLTIAAITFRQGSWNSIAQCVPGKTPKQCRDRWTNYLQPSLNFEPWSDQEDQLLVSLVNTHGTHWTKMKQYFPNRSTNSIKNRWYWLIKNQVKVIPANEITTSQIPFQSDLNQSSKNILEKNNLIGINLNDNFKDNDNINDNTNNSEINNQQQENNRQYYYFLKSRNKKKNLVKKPRKKNNINIINVNNINLRSNINIESNYFNMQQKIYNHNEDEIISFNPDELNW